MTARIYEGLTPEEITDFEAMRLLSEPPERFDELPRK